MITSKIDVTKIDKESIYHGKKGKYIDLILIEKANDYGDNGYVRQSISKERREAGENGPILGNWKWQEKKPPPPDPQKALIRDDDDIPF
jgi:hypothetical protein